MVASLPEPLSDVHRHLDGSLRKETVVELAARAGLPVPPDLTFTPGMGLDEALSKFAFTLSLLQTPESVRLVASEMCDDAAMDGVVALEIRFAPHLHRGAGVEVIVDAALEGAAGRAGLILCARYGEPPQVLEHLVRIAAVRTGVVGIDLAGAPAPAHDFGMNDYAPAYRLAAELGLGRTVHAAEGRPPQEIRTAIEVLGAQRIGHGTTLLDDVAIVDLVRERQVTIEACLTSNAHTGAIASVTEHPLPRWLDAGVRACICTDNTLLSAVTSSEEHRRAASIPGMTPEKLRQAIAWGHRARFVRRSS